MFEYSNHALVRLAHRNLNPDEIDYVIQYGQCFHQAGALIYYLRKRDLPAWDRLDDHWLRLAGTAVILTKDGRRVITTWRNPQRGLKHIKCKPKYRLSEAQLGGSTIVGLDRLAGE